jgi:hypothetical protein
MTCGLRSLSWNWFLAAYVALIAVLLFATPAHAATAPSFSIDDATAAEDSGTIVFRVRKHGRLNNLPSIINVYGVDGTAKFPTDFDSMNQSVTFAPGETVKLVAIHLVNDNVPEPTETFTAKLHAVSNARLYDGTAVGTITDSDVAAPIPPPAPASPTEPVVSPNGLKGEFDIADNFNVQTTLKPTVEMVPVSSDPVGAFRFSCLAGQLLYDDPPEPPHDRRIDLYAQCECDRSHAAALGLLAAGDARRCWERG